MWFETLVRERTGCAAYMIGCQATGECAVFDPLWDIEPYLEMARAKGSRIRYVIDSHSHADERGHALHHGRGEREAAAWGPACERLGEDYVGVASWSHVCSVFESHRRGFAWLDAIGNTVLHGHTALRSDVVG